MSAALPSSSPWQADPVRKDGVASIETNGPCQVLVVSSGARSEFAAMRRSLEQTAQVCYVATVADLLIETRTTALADLVVVEQDHAHSVSHAAIAELRRRNPLLPWIAVAGMWCDGELRTGDPWPADARVSWYEWTPWWESQLEGIARGVRPDWELPLTATPDERCLASSLQRECERSSVTGGVLVACADEPSFTTIRDGLARANRVAVWYRPGAGLPHVGNLVAVVYSGGQLGPAERAELAWLTARLPEIPVILLMDFPRLEMLDDIAATRGSQVLGKPYRLEQLIRLIGQAGQVRDA